MPTNVIGMRIRDKRKALGITQSDLAKRIEISASYLNLIENNKRGIAGRLLNLIAHELDMSLRELDGSGEQHLANELVELAADPLLAGIDVRTTTAGEFIGRYQDWAQALTVTFRAFQEKSDAVIALSDRLNHDPFLGDAVHKMLDNIAALRSTSDILNSVESIDPEQRQRFYKILSEESGRLSDVGQALANFFDMAHTEARTISPVEEVEEFIQQNLNYFPLIETTAEQLIHKGINIDKLAPEDIHQSENNPESLNFRRYAYFVADAMQAEIDHLVNAAPELVSDAGKRRARRALVSYGAACLRMPYEDYYQAAVDLSYDIERLQRRFSVSFEQACQRLTTLRRPGLEGIHFAFMRAGPAGHIGKRLPLPRLSLPRYGAACPLWILHRSFMRPERLIRQFAEFPNGNRFLFIAKAVPKGNPGFEKSRNFISIMLACEITDSAQTVYAKGIDTSSRGTPDPVGPNCRICTRNQCEYRAEDPILNA